MYPVVDVPYELTRGIAADPEHTAALDVIVAVQVTEADPLNPYQRRR